MSVHYQTIPTKRSPFCVPMLLCTGECNRASRCHHADARALCEFSICWCGFKLDTYLTRDCMYVYVPACAHVLCVIVCMCLHSCSRSVLACFHCALCEGTHRACHGAITHLLGLQTSQTSRTLFAVPSLQASWLAFMLPLFLFCSFTVGGGCID